MKEQLDYFLALTQIAKDAGAPDVLVCKAHLEQTKCDLQEFCNPIGKTLKVLEAKTQQANHVKLYIGLMKEAMPKDMQTTGLPLVLWDYCMKCRAMIFQITANKLFQINGTNPHTMLWAQTLISLTFANLVGTNGFTFEMSRQPSCTRKNRVALF